MRSWRRSLAPALEPGELSQILGAPGVELTSLRLTSANLSPGDVTQIERQVKLEALDLEAVRGLDDERVAALAGRLKVLGAGSCDLSPDVLWLAPLFELRSLRLSAMTRAFSDNDIVKLHDARNLEDLRLTQLYDTSANGLDALGALRSLKTLGLWDLPAIDNRTLSTLRRLPELSTVELTARGDRRTWLWLLDSDDFTRLDGYTPARLRALCRLRFLRGLAFTGEEQLDDDALRELRFLSGLIGLTIERCPNVRGSFLPSIPKIRHLGLAHSTGLSPDNLRALSDLRHLTSLSLAGTRLTSEVLEHVPLENLSGLDVADMHDEGNMTDRLHLPKTEYLRLAGVKLPAGSLREILRGAPRLKFIDVTRFRADDLTCNPRRAGARRRLPRSHDAATPRGAEGPEESPSTTTRSPSSRPSISSSEHASDDRRRR